MGVYSCKLFQMIFQQAVNRLKVINTILKKGLLFPPVLLKPSTSNCFSSTRESTHRNMRVLILGALEDNYMYLIIDDVTKECALVDPVEPQKAMTAIKNEQGLKLTTVLTTHHHWDHSGGNEELLKIAGKIPVYGADNRIKGLSNLIEDQDEFKIGSLKVQCMYTPCHTTGHMCYYVTEESGRSSPAVFTGDCLFVGGCGKFFEGNAKDMYRNVKDLGSLPSDTKVYCGHEYTVNNLKYAAFVEPDNQAIKTKASWAMAQRKANEPTIPSTIAEEKEYNPFMRVKEPSVQKHAQTTDAVQVMDFLRKEKDHFKAS